jgi:Zn-dependent alcohol dehydrogenase
VIKVGSGLSVDTTGTVSTTQIQRIRDAGAVNALTVDYNDDDVILCSTTGALTVSHQNFKAGKVVRVIISQPAKREITHGVSAANSNIGNVALAANIQTNVPNSVFIQFNSAGTSLALTYAQLVY